MPRLNRRMRVVALVIGALIAFQLMSLLLYGSGARRDSDAVTPPRELLRQKVAGLDGRPDMFDGDDAVLTIFTILRDGITSLSQGAFGSQVRIIWLST